MIPSSDSQLREPTSPEPGLRQPELRQPGSRQPELRQPGSRQPGSRQPEPRQAGSRQPGSRQPELRQAGSRPPESRVPGSPVSESRPHEFRPPEFRPPEFREPRPGTPRFTTMPSPISDLTLIGDGESLSAVYIGAKHRHAPEVGADWIRDDTAFVEVRRQLEEYFEGSRREFDLPLAPRGTKFQLQVWRALLEIPYGETTSYGKIAAGLGHPNGSRAVGAANGRNPISIIVPCHRVIGAGGSLVGYGGGLECKRTLLDLEQREEALFSLS